MIRKLLLIMIIGYLQCSCGDRRILDRLIRTEDDLVFLDHTALLKHTPAGVGKCEKMTRIAWATTVMADLLLLGCR